MALIHRLNNTVDSSAADISITACEDALFKLKVDRQNQTLSERWSS